MQPARHPFVALFGHSGVRGCGGEPFALMSQSTRALRNKLAAAGVPFSMPLEGDGEAAGAAGTAAGAGQGREGGRQGKAGAQVHKGQGVEAEGDGDLCDEVSVVWLGAGGWVGWGVEQEEEGGVEG